MTKRYANNTNYIVVAEPHLIHLYQINKGWIKSVQSKNPVLGIAAWGDVVATYSIKGIILVWYSLFEKYSYNISYMHWHSHTISSMCFSPDGSQLYSGGEEGVLVQWNLKRNIKQFFARLGAPIKNLGISSEGSCIAISTEDNHLSLLDTLKWSLAWKIENLTMSPISGLIAFANRIKLVVEPLRNDLVANGQPGHLQFFDPITDQLKKVLEIVPFNRISRTNYENMAAPIVEHFAFSTCGHKLATIDSRQLFYGQLIKQEIILQFWQLDDKISSDFLLDSSIESPHEQPVNSLVFNPMKDEVVTLSRDCTFKIWVTRIKQSPFEKQLAKSYWMCLLTGKYKIGMVPRCAAFSSDGSVLGIAFDDVVTVWAENGSSKLLIGSFVNKSTLTYKKSIVRFIAFVPKTGKLLLENETSITLWNVALNSEVWTVKGQILCSSVVSTANCKDLAVDSCFMGGNIGVCYLSTEDSSSHIQLFNEVSPLPLHQWMLEGQRVKSLNFLGSAKGLVALTTNHRIFLLNFDLLEATEISLNSAEMIEKSFRTEDLGPHRPFVPTGYVSAEDEMEVDMEQPPDQNEKIARKKSRKTTDSDIDQEL
eukprot:CAMPEP_0171451990 /NCGR_PEP_ID=MMETSP0945-20130129/274_1 /TAXON_ID=109269 /ORGANISM="Vaucheria litorea, Strain CCMP2940" /LENGTH=593 /DNA_ID=CAMNT_0011976561 /DNA_START=376 /DNA_END=2154 /DNA_ORIENTATION=+